MKPLKLLALALLVGANLASADASFVTLDRAGAARLADPGSHATPTIVALWSSDCAYCKKNLSLFTEIVATNPAVQLVTVAVEPTFEGLGEPLDRLAVPGRRFAYGDEAPEALGFALDPKWRGELPRTLIFDGRGAKEALSGVVSDEAARRALGVAAVPR